MATSHDPQPTTPPGRKLIVALHTLAGARFDEAISAEMSGFARRAGDDPLAADLVAELSAWLHRQAGTLVAQLVVRLGDVPVLGKSEMRVTLRALQTVASMAQDEALGAEIRTLLTSVHDGSDVDQYVAMRQLRSWATAHVGDLTRALRSAVGFGGALISAQGN